MYYEYKISEGRLWVRSTPTGEWQTAIGGIANGVNALLILDEQQRQEVFRLFCTHCGVPDPRCQCWNDE